jgi:hypothetical protein
MATASITFFVLEKKKTIVHCVVIIFLFGFVATKKVTAPSYHRLILWWRCKEKEKDNNFCHLF